MRAYAEIADDDEAAELLAAASLSLLLLLLLLLFGSSSDSELLSSLLLVPLNVEFESDCEFESECDENSSSLAVPSSPLPVEPDSPCSVARCNDASFSANHFFLASRAFLRSDCCSFIFFSRKFFRQKKKTPRKKNKQRKAQNVSLSLSLSLSLFLFLLSFALKVYNSVVKTVRTP
jgi:hypothetical protein